MFKRKVWMIVTALTVVMGGMLAFPLLGLGQEAVQAPLPAAPGFFAQLWAQLEAPVVNALAVAMIAGIGWLGMQARRAVALAKQKQIISEEENTAALAILTGVQTAYLEHVRNWKAGSSTGKLSKFQAQQALNYARDVAVETAARDGLSLLAKYGERKLMALIQRQVAESKASAFLDSPAARGMTMVLPAKNDLPQVTPGSSAKPNLN